MDEWKKKILLHLSWRNVLRGSLVGLGTILATAAAMAALMSGGVIDAAWLDRGAVFVLILGAFLGAGAAGRGGTAGDAVIAAVCLWLMLLCINGVFYGFKFSGVWVGALPVLGGAGASLLLKSGHKKPGSRRRRKHRHR